MPHLHGDADAALRHAHHRGVAVVDREETIDRHSLQKSHTRTLTDTLASTVALKTLTPTSTIKLTHTRFRGHSLLSSGNSGPQTQAPHLILAYKLGMNLGEVVIELQSPHKSPVNSKLDPSSMVSELGRRRMVRTPYVPARRTAAMVACSCDEQRAESTAALQLTLDDEPQGGLRTMRILFANTQQAHEEKSAAIAAPGAQLE